MVFFPLPEGVGFFSTMLCLNDSMSSCCSGMSPSTDGSYRTIANSSVGSCNGLGGITILAFVPNANGILCLGTYPLMGTVKDLRKVDDMVSSREGSAFSRDSDNASFRFTLVSASSDKSIFAYVVWALLDDLTPYLLAWSVLFTLKGTLNGLVNVARDWLGSNLLGLRLGLAPAPIPFGGLSGNLGRAICYSLENGSVC